MSRKIPWLEFTYNATVISGCFSVYQFQKQKILPKIIANEIASLEFPLSSQLKPGPVSLVVLTMHSWFCLFSVLTVIGPQKFLFLYLLSVLCAFYNWMGISFPRFVKFSCMILLKMFSLLLAWILLCSIDLVFPWYPKGLTYSIHALKKFF